MRQQVIARMKSIWFVLVLSVGVVMSSAADDERPEITSKPAQSLAPGYRDLAFPAPVPGTYKLPILGLASDGNVLDSSGKPTTLHTIFSDASPAKIVLLSFIYSTCNDINGCPLATAVLHKIKSRLEKEPELARHLRLITLSFNPEHDTPEQMKAFGSSLQGKDVEWLFLTTRSERELQPILKDYHQNIEKVYAKNGKFTGTYNHNLRVFLIDQNKQIRNIYNTELLHADTLLSDIRTLLQIDLQTDAKSSESATTTIYKSVLYTAGDNKLAYEKKDYQTQSIALKHRKGQATDLLKNVKIPPLGLPEVPVPDNNPLTREKIALGRKLFYDRRLSLNNTVSCAMCHIPEQGFTSNEMATAVGIEGRTVRRNSPTLYNVAYMQSLFHDGRETNLEQQVWSPLLAHNEMANPSIGTVIEKIKKNPDYAGLFEAAFQNKPGMETVGMAIASYERTLNSANSPFDRWHYQKDKHAVNSAAQRGFTLFIGKANCNQCHSINADYALFTDNKVHNTSIGFIAAMHKPALTQSVQIAPGIYTNIPSEVINSVSEIKANDLGRYEVTQNPQDRWQYKTPTLRNISLTAPYMHNGSLATLQEVVKFYNRGGIVNDNLDPLIKPLGLSPAEICDLTAFLESLNGSNVEELVSDAFAAPIGDIE